MGLPVVITPDISDDSDIIKENKIGAIIDPLDEGSYLIALKEIEQILKEDDFNRRNRIRSIAVKYRNFDIAEKVYKDIFIVQGYIPRQNSSNRSFFDLDTH